MCLDSSDNDDDYNLGRPHSAVLASLEDKWPWPAVKALKFPAELLGATCTVPSR